MSTSSSDRISLFFPVYRDERTIERVAAKAHRVLAELTSDYEIIVVNDGSPDRAGEIADELARRSPRVRVIHHGSNLGYGRALRTGLEAARYEWIAFTDGDDEYEVDDLRKLWRLRDSYDLILTFRYAKRYGSARIFISFVYNNLLRSVFRTRYRDISCGLRLIRKEVAAELPLRSSSPFIGAEIAIKTMLKGFRVGEVGIQTFPAGVWTGLLDEREEHPRHPARHAARLPRGLFRRVRPPPEPLNGSGRSGPGARSRC